jgi:hypothetical protein
MLEERYGLPPPTPDPDASGARWRRIIALIVFSVGAAYFLLTEHRAHTIQALPWVIVLSCPLIHVFMHRGHGGHGGSHDPRDPGSQEGPP